MTNPFDQFDNVEESPTSVNPFDQFDKPSPEERIAKADAYNAQLNQQMNIQEEPKAETGFFNNAARGIADRGTEIVGNLAEGVSQLGDYAESKIPAGGLVWNEGDLFPAYKSGEEFKRLKEQGMKDVVRETGKNLRDINAGYQQRHTWESVKEKFSKGEITGGIGEVFKYGTESGIYSIPDMAAMVVALPPYIFSRSTEMGSIRAENKGKAAPDIEDTLEAAPFAIGSVLVDRIGLQGMTNAGKDAIEELGADAMKSILPTVTKAVAKGASKEALTEAIQEGLIEYTGERFGTDAKMTFAEGLDRGAGAAVAGGVYGGAVGAGSGVLANRNARVEDGEIDLPQNGEALAEDVDLGVQDSGVLQLSHDPQRMIVHPDGTTSWEGETESLPPVAASQHPAYAKINQSPDQIESELVGDTDIDNELQQLMAELDQAESIARSAIPMVPEGVNPFDQFDTNADPVGLFDGIRQSQAEQKEIARAHEIAQQEMASANFQEDDQRGFMGQVSRLQEQTQFDPVNNRTDIADLSEIYPADPTVQRTRTAALPKEESKIPEGFSDQRITRPEFRSQLERMGKELVKGGGISYVRNERGDIAGRTPSLNADWFKAVGENPETSMSVEDTQAAITKALSGEKLGVRQARVVSAALDAISGERGAFARELQAMRENARADRQAAFDQWKAATSAPDDAEFATNITASPGEVFQEQDYLPHHDMDSRALAELADQATEMGASWKAIDNALEMEDIGSQTKALTELIWGLRNEHRTNTAKTAGNIAVTEKGESGSRSGAAQGLAEIPPNPSPETADQSDTPITAIDAAASEAATSPLNDLPEPTEAQKEAGNYKKGHTRIHGLDIAIENPRGSTRSGTDDKGNSWSVKMHSHYGYIKRTEGADGDHVDVFVGPNPNSDRVFVVDQVNADGSFDEHKVLMGFDSKLKARSGYKSNYSSGWKVGPITGMSMEEFKGWLKEGDTRKPLSSHFADAGKTVNQIKDKLEAVPPTTGSVKEKANSLPEAEANENIERVVDANKPTIAPEILTESRAKYIARMAKDRGIKKDSPGYSAAMDKIEADYDLELDRAHAGLPFEEFNRLNNDSSESLNRQAWNALRDEYGIAEGEAIYSGNERETSNLPNRERNQSSIQEPAADIGRGNQLDLFLHSKADKRKAYSDIYGTIIKPRPIAHVSSATESIHSIEDVAHLLASIRKDPQESFYAIATDASGKILRVMNFTRGTADGAGVFPVDVVAEAASIDGAAYLHLAHNHPSGGIKASSADERITERIFDMLDGTGIKPGHHAIVGEFKWGDGANANGANGKIRPRLRKFSIPITQRRYVTRGTLGDPITGPADAARMTANHENALFLLSAQNAPVAIVTLSDQEMETLRKDGQVNRILTAINSTNARAAIIKTDNIDAAVNLSKLLNSLNEIRVHDWISSRGSDASRGGSVTDSSGYFYSLGTEQTTKGLRKADVKPIINRILSEWNNPHIKIQVVTALDEFPAGPREKILQHNKENQHDPISAKALYHNGTVYVNASAMRNALDVERAVFHEVHGHYGVRALFGRETSIAMGRLYFAIGGEKGIREIAEKHGIDLSRYEQILKGESPIKRAEILTDELLAHIAQDSKPTVKRFLQELIGAIRTWLRAHGFTGLGQFSDSEIMALLKRTREAATKLKFDGGSVARVLLNDADNKIAVKKDSQASLAYSLSGLPPNTRKIIGKDPLLAAWSMVAQRDESFQLPVSDKKSLEAIFADIMPGVQIRRAPEFDTNGAQVWAVNPKRDTLALIFQKNKSVWIDVADYSDGQGGRQIYNAVANYAYNSGKTFIGDPAGLSDKAMARRLENMLSSALKFGTTEHLWPHEKQLEGGAGVPPIKWKDGEHVDNLKEMIRASYQSVINQFPEIQDLRYNPQTDQIEGAKDGKVYSRTDLKAIAARKRDSSGTGGQPITAGSTTLERAILTHTISRGTRQEQFNILAALGMQRSERLAGLLYSLAPPANSDTETRPSGGFSVSGVKQKLGLAKDDRGSGLPPNVRFAYDMLGGKHKTFADKVKQQVKRQLAPGGLLPREIFDLKIARDSEMNAEDNQQRYILGDFYKQIEEVYKKPYQQLKAATRKEIDDYLKGDRTQVKLTKSMIAVLGKMRSHIQNLSSRYIDELLLDAANLEFQGKKAEADEKRRLIATITENFDSYLHRSYRAFDDPDWPKKVPPDVYKTAVEYLAKQYAGSDPVNAEHIREATKKVDLMLHEGTAYDSMARFIAESKLGSKDLSVLKKRKQISPEIRALLGEYEDPVINYAKSVSKMTRLVSNTAFLRQMKDMALELGYIYEESDRPVGANKKIAADASEVYSPLNGLYTFPEFEQALRDAVGSNKEPDWYKWIVTANAAVKYGKTVLAPTTAMRNILSASMFTLTSGHWNMAHLDKSINSVKTYFTGDDVRGSRDYINKLLKLGVLYDAPNYRELQELIKQVNESESLTAKALRKSKAAAVLNYAQEFYALGDDFWKILGFENEKSMLMKHYKMSEADAEKEAAERIRNTYPTYSMTGRAIQMLRRFPLVGSFPSFPAEIIRTTYHKFRYFHQDAKSLGYQNPAVIAKAVGLGLGAGLMGAISALSAALYGVDDDEEEAIRQMLPEWSRNSNLLFLGRDDGGQVEYMDLTWLDPYSYWKKPLEALSREQNITERSADAVWEALSPFLGADIAFGAALKFFDDLRNPGVTTETATEKLGKSLAPGVVTNALGFWNAIDETVTKSGKKYTLEDEVLALFGFRKGTLNAKVGLTYQAYGYQDKKRAAATVLREKATNLGKVDLDELRGAYEQSMQMHKEAWDEMRRTVKLAEKVGMTEAEAIAALRTSGISLRDARLIVADQEFRYQPPKNMMKLAIKRAAILFDKETQEELKSRVESLNALQAEYQEKPAR